MTETWICILSPKYNLCLGPIIHNIYMGSAAENSQFEQFIFNV